MTTAVAFEHEALFYEDDESFLAGTAPFVRAGVDAREPVLVAVDRRKIELLRNELGSVADDVAFLDMAEIGGNPARIIPVWTDFVREDAAGQPCRGIGEPLWPGRTDAERAECHRHEQLLNLAFVDAAGFRLLCPYDTALAPDDVDRSRLNHPVVTCGGKRQTGHEQAQGRFDVFDAPLPPVTGDVTELSLDNARDLAGIRSTVAELARRARLEETTRRGFVLAVNELAANSLRHGGGRGSVALWLGDGSLVCQVEDEGHISNPLAGRVRPPRDGTGDEGGRGLWLVNQLCDLVEVRTSPSGTTVRVRASARNGTAGRNGTRPPERIR